MKEAVHFSIFQGFSWIWIVVTNTLLCFRCSFYNVPMLSFYFKIMCFSFLSFMNLTLVLLTKSIFYRYLLEKAMTPHSSTLAWKIPWTREPGRLQSMGSLGVGHDWVTSFSLFTHALEKEMATHSSVFAWRIPRTGEPGGLPSMGSHRVRHDWSDSAAAASCNLSH